MSTRRTTRVLFGAGLEHAPSVRCALIAALCVSMLLVGCTSYQNVKDENDPDVMRSARKHIKVTLKDGTILDAPRGHYITVDEPSTLVYVYGGSYSKLDKRNIYFAGTLKPTTVETVTVRNEVLLDFRERDSVTVTSRPEDCIFVGSTVGSGLWIVGTSTKAGGTQPFTGRIAPQDIEKVEFQEGVTGGKILTFAGWFTLVMMLAASFSVIGAGGFK